MEGYLSNMTQEQSYSPVGGYIQQQGSTGNVPAMTNSVSDEMLTELKAGDTFQGEIMSVNGKEVQLQLLNGQYMTAKLEAQMQLALGQILNFEVQSNQNSRIVLKPLYTNLMQQQVGEAALRAANLAVNDKSLQLVSLMIENGMSIDKNSLPKMYRQIVQHPQAQVADILQLNKLNIPVTDNNILQYSQYRNLEYKLTDGIQAVAKEIIDLYDQLARETLSEGQINNNTIQSGEISDPSVRYMDQILDFLLKEPIAEKNSIQQSAEIPESTVSLPEHVQTGNKQQTPEQNEQTMQQTPEQNGQTVQQTTVQNGQTVQQTPEQNGQTMQQTPLPNGQTIQQDDQAASKEGQIIEKDRNLSKLLGQLDAWLKETPQKKKVIYSSDPFRDTVKEMLIRKWTLNPQEIGKEGKVEQYYRRLAAQSERLSEIMLEASKNSTSGESVRNIRNNLEFMNDLNQTFQYVQLPLRMSGKEAHGELYVYTNKRNLARNDGTLTALLHLDMEQLGAMDINISLETEKNILTTCFSLEEDIVDFMESHMEELTQKLTKAGYRAKAYIEVRKTDKSVLQSMEERLPGGSVQLSYQAFDMKA